MRFISDGPSIPDELLLARDQGRVVFFCGAGVSRAKANLADFFELAATVTQALGVQQNDPVMRIIAEVKDIGRRTSVDGLISADRIFGLLERDFLSRDINEAVAKALTPKDLPDLSAHQTLLRLATTREGLVRLVTTNFDRLFDCCRPDLPTYTYPNLPTPSRAIEFNGTVYLHGKINSAGNGAEGDGFVLSSSEFGKAYLSEGWATSFVREILDRYFVVFVGYSADDPPVQYLLEALNRTSGPMEGVYAFQSGDANYANSKWRHKGVTAIAYDGKNGHSALWSTLSAWADRAENPDAWLVNVVEKAKSGPENLQPHERGQVAHVVSTIEGLRKFSEGDNPPPATWLCVFDPFRRYAKPGRQGRLGEMGAYVDPFELYSLDSDSIPNKIDPEDLYEKREVPKGAWDAFALSKLDRSELRDENLSSLRGHWSRQSPRLPARQFQLGIWISKVARQQEAVWWAAHQNGIHAEIREQIAWELERAGDDTATVITNAWRYLFDFWSVYNDEHSRDWYVFASEIAKRGWTEISLRHFADFSKPYLKVAENFWSGPIPEVKAESCLGDLINLDVTYPELPHNISVPDGQIARVIAILRRNLETALELENEIGGYGLSNISPINPDNGGGDAYLRDHGLSAWVLYFVRQFERLMQLDVNAAVSEFSRWPSNDVTIFARLRIWALGEPTLVSSERFGAHLESLQDEAFWNGNHARDLLLAISARWGDLAAETRSGAEQRILRGPGRWEREEEESYKERRAWSILSILNWMHLQGCSLQLDLERITEELRQDAPEWKPEYARNAAQSREGRSGSVRTETEHAALLQVPLASILTKAKELSGRHGMEFVEYAPFAGLSQERPVRAFAALRLAASSNQIPEWAWSDFLNPDRRKNDRLKFTAFIGEQISRFSDEEVSTIVRPVCDWIKAFAKVIAAQYPDLFSRLVSKAINALSLRTAENATAIIRGNRKIDWTMEAINSPTGYLAQALICDPKTDGLNAQEGFPKNWLQHLERLLLLPENPRRYALTIFTHDLSWFFYIDPVWTKSNLLSVLDANDAQDKDAFWAGFLWGGKARGRELFMTLKPHMLQLAVSESLVSRGHAEMLTGLLLSGWATSDESTDDRWISNEELRSILINSNDNVRSQILWHAERWAKETPDTWAPLLVQLLTNVWPRQIAAKSGIVSAKLCDIAFSNENWFPQLATIVLPLLTKFDGDRLTLPNLRQSRDNIVDRHPREMLLLLHAVLPDNVAHWPYGIDETITRIGQADRSLDRDERLIELKRKWDSR